MITPMDQLLVVGRKPVANDVLVALQSLGVVHVDRLEPGLEGLEPFALSAEEQRRKGVWDLVVARTGTLMELMGVDPETPGPGKGDLPADPDGVAERVDAVGEQADALLAERAQAREELALVEQYLPLFRDLAPTLAQLETSRWLDGVATIVPAAALDELRSRLAEALEGRFALATEGRGRDAIVVIAALRSEAAALRTGLGKAGLGELQLPERYRSLGVAKAVHVMEERGQALPKRLAAIEDELHKLALQHGARLKTLRQTALNHQSRYERLLELAEGRYAFALQGWLPRADRQKTVDALMKQFGADLLVTHRPADEHHDVGVPVRLENAPWARPFQLFLGVFAPPSYGGFDPTWTMAVFFPLFFGVIVGDIAFGLIFALLGALLRRRGLRGKPLSLGPLNMVIPSTALGPISQIIFYCSAWTVVWGFVYGEFFGTFLEYYPRARPIFYTTEHYPTGHGLIEILLFRVEVFLPIILISIALGVVHVLGGWVIRVVYGLKHRDMRHVYEGIGMFSGLVALIVFATFFLGDALSPAVTAFVAVGLAIFLVCVVLARMPMMLIEIVSNGGNILSYLRLFAVGLAAALVAKLATELGFAISGSLPIIGPILAIVIGVFVHLLALLLKVIGYTLQPLRLHYVEFFTKFGFYESTSRRYAPFRLLGGKS
jgi:V/A-type H+/Na+-transporting ATPase subunit I